MRIKFNFDRVVNRQNTNSLKVDKFAKLNSVSKKLEYDEKILPLWVADTDFESPPIISEEINKRVSHGLFGYGKENYEDKEIIQRYLKNTHKLGSISHSDILILSGLVSALASVVKLASNTNSAILTFTPIYPPFLQLPKQYNAKLYTSPLVIGQDKKYTFNFEEIETLLRSSEIKIKWLMLCNPHNPVGKAFKMSELKTLSDLAKIYDLNVCSDEVHSDLVFDKQSQHIPFMKLFGEDKLITLMGPGKTFNLAGLGCSFAVCKDKTLKMQFRDIRKGIVPELNILGMTAMTCAYKHLECYDYRDDLVEYLRGNYDLIKDRLNPIGALEHEMDSTFLAFLNMQKIYEALNIKFKKNTILEDFKLGLNEGGTFGEGENNQYNKYARLNFACSRSVLVEALDRLTSVPS